MELEKDLKIDIKREHKKEIEIITEELKQRYYDFIQKEIPEDIFALYIDAYQAEMKDKQTGKVKTITILDGHRHHPKLEKDGIGLLP